jgi:hypothetical protein
MINGNPPRREAVKSSPEIRLGFFVGLKKAQAAGSLISTYRVVSTTFKS